MESIAIITGIIGVFGGVGSFVYFSLKNKEILDELDKQDKKIASMKGKLATYKKAFELESQSNGKLIKLNELLHQDVKNIKRRYKNLSEDYNKVREENHKLKGDVK